MENKDLGNKKINNEQKHNEGFSGENLPEDYNPAPQKLQQELETDKNGDAGTVARARDTGGNETGLEDNQTQKAVENKDRNSDLASNRYPADHPENQHNRGNIKLDQ